MEGDEYYVNKAQGVVEDDTFLRTITQSPVMMGYYCSYALIDAANGQEGIHDFSFCDTQVFLYLTDPVDNALK